MGGALCGKAMLEVGFVDYLRLVVIYLVLLIIRGGFIFASLPILRHEPKQRACNHG